MNKRRIIGIILIVICSIVILFGNAGTEAIPPAIVFYTIGIYLVFKKSKRKKILTKELPKCNCDGCPKQEECQYGHTIRDDITGERLALWTKFIFLHAFDKFEYKEENVDIATQEEMRNQNILLKMDEEKLLRTLDYLEAEKKWYYTMQKCGIAYYQYMKMGCVRHSVFEALQLKRKIEKERKKTTKKNTF